MLNLLCFTGFAVLLKHIQTLEARPKPCHLKPHETRHNASSFSLCGGGPRSVFCRGGSAAARDEGLLTLTSVSKYPGFAGFKGGEELLKPRYACPWRSDSPAEGREPATAERVPSRFRVQGFEFSFGKLRAGARI